MRRWRNADPFFASLSGPEATGPPSHLKIENPPYMALVIEATPEPGPLGLAAISVAHYGEQNGDLMRDPEMCFELSKADSGKLSARPLLLAQRLHGFGTVVP